MAFLGIKVPDNVGRMLSCIKVPGEKTSPSEMHITLFYFESFSIQDATQSIDAVYSAIAKVKPFSVQIETVSHFPGWGEKNDKCAVIAKISSSELHQFRKNLAASLDEAEIEFSKTYKEYKPHITLSYSSKEPKDFNLPQPIEFMVSEITLWCGEEMNDKLIVDFPLSSVHKYSSLLRKTEMFEKFASF